MPRTCADVDARDAHLVARVEAAGVGELCVVRRGAKIIGTLAKLCPTPMTSTRMMMPINPLRMRLALRCSHCGVHLPVGCGQTLTVRTGPPGCRPFSFSEMSQA